MEEDTEIDRFLPVRERKTVAAERLDMPVDGEADRSAQILQRAVLDHLLAGRMHELQLGRIDNVDLGGPVAILLRHRREERDDGNAMEAYARAEMPVKIRSEEHTSELQSLM